MGSTAVRLFVSDALARLPQRYRLLAYQLVKRVIPGKREALAARYLRGSGIEIGAMHNPLRVPRGVSVQYVDYLSREENVERFTEIRDLHLVTPNVVEDGFTLPSFGGSSVDFLIANHVLEHTDNVLKALIRWAEVLRPNGILFLSVPLAERCFDRGRSITTTEHFVADYELERSGHNEIFREHTRQHYADWLSISLPAILAEQGKNAGSKIMEDMAKTADDLLTEKAEIHFHTFTAATYKELLRHFCAHVRSDFQIVEVVENGIEVIGVLQRNGLSTLA